jgi:hypothetical protein
VELRQKFGPEYDRAVLKHGSERKAEAKLADREKRVEKLNIRDLDPVEHERFLKRWESVQSRFVHSPKGAVTEADDLVSSLMKVRIVSSKLPANSLSALGGFNMSLETILIIVLVVFLLGGGGWYWGRGRG